jgi:hypothetical protein
MCMGLKTLTGVPLLDVAVGQLHLPAPLRSHALTTTSHLFDSNTQLKVAKDKERHQVFYQVRIGSLHSTAVKADKVCCMIQAS